MTTQQKLEAIREKCISANPEIVELKFGCQVYAPWRTRIVKHTVIYTDRDKVYVAESRRRDEDFPNVGTTKRFSSESIKYWGIIGRPITLFDVVQAIRKVGYSSTDEWYKTLGHLVDYWSIHRDKGDDLNVKTEGTIDFIHSLLCESYVP